MTIAIDADALQAQIDELAGFSEVPAPAVTRVLFSDVDLAARAWLARRFDEEGLEIRTDAVGNTFARWPGRDAQAPAIATGSHIDAIPNAGRYDGVVGVLGALEAVRFLRRTGFEPQRSIEIVVFTAEEPTRFGIGCLGSRLLSGSLEPARAASLADRDRLTLEQWRHRAGFGDRPLSSVVLAKGAYAAFVELHIEQGPLLERDGLAIGIVEAIAGPSSYRLTLTGEGGHAGAVLMADRRDAGLAGAEVALAVEQAALASGSPDTVGTTGVFVQRPGAINSIPCDVTLEIDFRDARLDTRGAAWARVESAITDICARRGVAWHLERLNADPPARCAPALVDLVSEVCATENVGHRRMISRAYHDSLFMAQVCPTTMIFVPCRGGISHRPDEYSSPRQIAAGARVLARVLERLAVGGADSPLSDRT
jgi:N-carbamoyl-L-amino-acid hydrolase